MLDTHDAEALVDPRIRGLVERYAELTGARLTWESTDLATLDIPHSELAYFASEGRLPMAQVRLAFSLHALESDPDAEMATVGSAFLERITEAVRERGWRRRYAPLPVEVAPDEGVPALQVAIRGSEVADSKHEILQHRLGRVLARVVIRGGAEVSEQLVESDVFDLVSATPVGSSLAERCNPVQGADAGAAEPSWVTVAALADADSWLSRMLTGIQQKLASAFEAHELAAGKALRAELKRLGRYYEQMAKDDGGAGGKRAAVLEREHEKRKAEEERRHQVRAVLHPVQLQEWPVLVERAEWCLQSPAGKTGPVSAQRYLAGDGEWTLYCPKCGARPEWVTVCAHEHAACAACASFCSVCGHGFCGDHGLDACRVDGEPVCEEHARTCSSCGEGYCAAHEAACDAGSHVTCSECIETCALCGKTGCNRHVVQTPEGAPNGPRTLCPECVVYCEGGSSEPVGRDEAEDCASCERSVCRAHQARCAVDGLVHCSRHLRRSDHTRRLVCESHRATCYLERDAIIASDEITTCTECGEPVCTRHSDTCLAHGSAFCRRHLAPLLDTDGGMGCDAHRTVCHVDGATFSLAGTSACPVCTKPTCRNHHVRCRNCGRRVCSTDMRADGSCATCIGLAPGGELDDDVIAAVVGALGDVSLRAKEWRTARDASHRVVQADLGWRRRLVFAVPHGASEATSVVRHGLFGGRQLK